MSKFESCGGGVYREGTTGKYYHRPTINGGRTWRVLDAHTLKLARDLKAHLDTQQGMAKAGLGKDPYVVAAESITIGKLIENYKAAGCPRIDGRPRTGTQLDQELSRIKYLEPFWSERKAPESKPTHCFAYVEERKKGLKSGFSGGRTFDMELCTLASVFRHGFYSQKLESNPMVKLPKFRSKFNAQHGKEVRHCRDCMPHDAAQLHALARVLFSERKSEALGWQLLLEAMTGCRTSEVLRLRWDAPFFGTYGKAGCIEKEQLWLERSKKGINPSVTIHPALAQTLEALKVWRAWRGKIDSPWFLPSLRGSGLEPLDKCSLTHKLARISEAVIGHRVTSHGLRAYYVTVRRSMGISDGQIAVEIGDKTGATIIESTYGAIPPGWQNGKAPEMGWAVDEPAWLALNMPENVIAVSVHK